MFERKMSLLPIISKRGLIFCKEILACWTHQRKWFEFSSYKINSGYRPVITYNNSASTIRKSHALVHVDGLMIKNEDTVVINLFTMQTNKKTFPARSENHMKKLPTGESRWYNLFCFYSKPMQ